MSEEKNKEDGPEVQLKKCKICGELKRRIGHGRFGTKKDKRWVDEDGRQWMGLVCPPCNVERSKAYQKARLANK